MSEPGKEFAFKVKNFGNEFECSSFSELMSVLDSQFRGKSVSIVFPVLPSGMLNTVFVDVKSDGSVYLSYGNQRKLTPQDVGA